MRSFVAAATTVALLAAAAQASTVTLFEDDFNDGLDASWTQEDLRITSSPFEWTTNDQVRRDGGFGEVYGNYTGGDGLAATASSDGAPGVYDVALVSPVIAIPEVATDVLLSYDANYQNFQNSDRAHTDISDDGGLTWISILQWAEDHGSFFGGPNGDQGGERVELDLSGYAGQEIQFRFRYFEPNGGTLSFYWQVDNVSLTAVPTPGALALLAPAGLLASRRRRR